MPDENIKTTLQFQADITDFKSAMQEANRAVKLANSEFKAASSGMDDWGSSTDGLAAKLNQLAAVHDAEKRKLDVLQAAYQKAVAEQGAASAAAVDLQTKINNQQAVVNKTQKEFDSYAAKLKEVESGADGAAADIKKAGDAAKKSGEDAEDGAGGWTIIKDVIADFVANTIDWAVESFKELMTAGDNALATLGARTGATAEQMGQYRDVMNEIYRSNFGESFDDVSDAMGVVIQTFGELDKASLQNITQKAIALRDTFGFDYQESMRAVNSMMDQFGLTADEAFNLIAQGAQKGLDQNGDLLDTINEYSVQFSTAGYSADEMFNMLKNGADSGTWSVDKLGDAVKEFNIRAKDGTVADALVEYKNQLGLTDEQVKALTADMQAGGTRGQEAYNTILGALGNVGNETDKYQAGVALFGTMWEDLGETTVQSLMKTEGEISKTQAAMDNLTNTKYDTLSSAMEGLGRVIQTDLLQPIADKLAPIIKDLVEWAIENMPTIAPIVTGIATAVGVLAAALAIQGLISGVTKAFALLNTTMLANPFVLIAAALAGLVAGFVALWNKSEAFRDFWTGLWEGIKNAFSAVVDWFGNAASSIGDFFSNAWQGIKNAWSGAKDWFGNVREGINNVFSNVGDWFSEKFTQAKDLAQKAWSGVKDYFGKVREDINKKFENIGNWFSDKFTKAKDLAQKAWSGVKDYFGKVKDGVTGTWSKFDSWMGNKFGDAWTEAKSKFASSTVGKYFSQIGDSIKGVFSGVKSALSGNFSDAWASIKGVFSGWGNFFRDLWGQVKSIFSNAYNNMSDVGKNIVSGIWEGISNSFRWIKDKISGWVGDVLDFIKDLFGIHSPSTVMRDQVGKMLGMGMAEGITDSRNAVNSAVRKLGDAALDGLPKGGGGGAPGAAAGGRVINYTQNNYSPRALSRREIYRQTHNALAFAGGGS